MKRGLLALTHATAATKIRSPLLVAALFALAVTACGKQDEAKPAAAPAAAPIATAAAPATVAPADAAPAVAASATPAAGSGKKPNILFIMGDDVGWMQPSIYHQGLMVGETPNIDRIGHEGAKFMTYYAEQSCTAGRTAFFTGMTPLRAGMIPPQLPGDSATLMRVRDQVPLD